ncbi:excinuclease ABC subunit UvrC, partial [Candidatus Dependentiae bacterium]|nr:excinuclease ABC subunit UvrC [Candidatus Dependentiae bacterium]
MINSRFMRYTLGSMTKQSFLHSRLAHLPSLPGVYQMLDAYDEIIYVGKAKNLKKRVASYFKASHENSKTAVLVKHIRDIRTIVTASENEALLLENNLIKQFRPRYNILFKDDKSYPYLIFSNHCFPRLDLIRTQKTPKEAYFGPYSDGGAARQTVQLVEKLFQLRNCSESFFAHRSRPCLQYHIKRCSAPCVGYIDQKNYAESVARAKLFLQGKNDQVEVILTEAMEAASHALDYEKAAFYRDQIRQLRQIASEQIVQKGRKSFDVLVVYAENQQVVVQILKIRQGKIVAEQSYLPENKLELAPAEVLQEFIAHAYLETEQEVPSEIVVNLVLPSQRMLREALSAQEKRRIVVKTAVRGESAALVKMAENNAKQRLLSHLAHTSTMQTRFAQLEAVLDLPLESLRRLECFDVSHTFGEATVASCVVFDREGPNKKSYRIFNITGVRASDDFAAMRQALLRRYQHAKEAGVLPDLVVIDGGLGQLQQAIDVFKELHLVSVVLLGIAKGPTR